MSSDTRPKILVVDDEAANLKIMKRFLEERYALSYAKTGADALALAIDTVPDLILMDIVMPEMDGIEACRRLKADPRTEKVPVIFVTARGDIEDETQGFEAGGVDYITKPVRPVILKARIRTHLALQYQNRELERQIKAQTSEINQTRLSIIQRLGRAAEYKDNETGFHIMRISHYSRIIALSHHEKWDGTGYPRGLAGENIPLLGRIVAIADVYDALITERVYKKAWPVEKAVAHIQQQAGRHFDPGLTACFLDRLDEMKKIRHQYPEPEPKAQIS